MTILDYAAGVLPVWNQFMFYFMQTWDPEFWVRDDQSEKSTTVNRRRH